MPIHLYYPVVGAVLVLSAILMARSALRRSARTPETARSQPFLPALATGAAIGFVSGTTGTGGGVFLAPVILAMGWAPARQAAAITAVYNPINSAAALLGASVSWGTLPTALPLWLLAVGLGGTVGAVMGSCYLPDRVLRAILALRLLLSSLKLILE